MVSFNRPEPKDSKISQAISPAPTRTKTARVTEILDTDGWPANFLCLTVGAVNAGDAHYQITFEASDDPCMAGAAPVDDSELEGVQRDVPAEHNEGAHKIPLAFRSISIRYRGAKRYTRATVTLEPNGWPMTLSGTWVQSNVDQVEPPPH